jgi:signal recognition particle GTPase
LREGDEGYDKLKKMRSDRIEKANTEQELLERYNSNMENFPAKFDEWASQRGLKEEDKEGMFAFLDDMLVKLVSGDVDKDVLDKIYQAYSYKRDIGDLDEDRAIAAKNAENVNQKSETPILPIPEGNSPVSKPKMEAGKTPFDDVFENEKRRKF